MKALIYINKNLIFLGFLLLFSTNYTSACEIEIKVDGEQKEEYKIGDEIVIHVRVEFTHRVCPEGIKKTKFDTKGFKILKGTPWKETSTGVWERKLKVQVTKSKKGKLLLSATRTCEKDGGFGEITLHAATE